MIGKGIKRITLMLAMTCILSFIGAGALAAEAFVDLKKELTMYVGDIVSLKGKATTLKGKSTVSWSIAPVGIVDIEQDSKVRERVHLKAVAAGEAVLTMTVTDEQTTYIKTCALSVPQTPERVEISGVQELMVGQSTILAAKVFPETAMDGKYTWKSSNSAVASVDMHGHVQALSKGTVRISAVAANRLESPPFEITVTPVPLPTVDILKEGIPIVTMPTEIPKPDPAVPLVAGSTLQLTLGNLDQKYDPSWLQYSFGTTDASVAVVSDTGLVTAYSSGIVKIYIMDKRSSTLLRVWEFNVYDAAAITLSSKSASVKAGQTKQLFAYVNGFATNVRWASEDAAIAAVNEKGVITGISRGRTNIIGFLNDKIYARCKVTIR